MNNLVLHIEYLLAGHDCVVIPCFGALVKRKYNALYDANHKKISAPGQEIAFNREISYDDGLLASSISRRECISFTEASAMLNDEVAAMKAQLDYDGEFDLGSLGRFVSNDGHIVFKPANENFVLQELSLQPISDISLDAEEEDDVREISALTHYTNIASRVAAAIAILLIFTFTIYNPTQIRDGVMKASLIPDFRSNIDTDEVQCQIEDAVVVIDEVVTPDEEELPFEPVVEEEIISESLSEEVVEQESMAIAVNDFKYYLIVASLPNDELADRFISDNHLCECGRIYADGRVRVWTKSSDSYSGAFDSETVDRFPDAWVYKAN